MSLLIVILLTGLVSNGIYLAAGEGGILEPLDKLLKLSHKLIYYPIIGCITCMSSVWGTVVTFTISPELWVYLPIIIPSAAYVNTLLYNLYLKI